MPSEDHDHGVSDHADRGLDKVQVEQGIDVVDWLRKTMRSLGMLDCADALDDAFVKCLHAYLALFEGDGSANAIELRQQPDKAN